MLVHEYLRRAAESTPDAIAVIERRGSVTYRELEDRARRLGRVLIGADLRPGDRVVIALENSADFIACYFGVLEAGAVAVPLAHGSRSDRLLKVCADCAPVACIVDAGAWELIASALPPSVSLVLVAGDATPVAHTGFPTRVQSVRLAMEASTSDPLKVRRIDTDLAAIIYTSGSTGAPRGVMLTHLNICANTSSIVSYLNLTRSDRALVVLPFFYVYGLSLLHTHVAVGGTLVLVNSLAFPNVVLNAMRAHEVTGFAGVPSTFALLLERSDIASVELPALRYITQAGGAMPPARIRQWLRVMPGVPFYVMYGATEASARLAYLDPADLPTHIGSIGKAIPNVELRVLAEDGSAVLPGAVGEIVARGSNIAAGYWNDPEETRARFRPEGFRTGDLGREDEDGFLYIIGRRGDMMKIGAHRVSAREIEDSLCECPGVYEAAVVPVEHAVLGESALAYVAVQDACVTEADIIAFCRRHMAEHKVPAEIRVRADLPKNAAGKIDRVRLRSLAGVAATPDQALSIGRADS